MQNEIIRLRKKRINFNVCREEIEQLLNDLPGEDEVIKLISFGGFSSIGIIKFISSKTVIRDLKVSSLRVGKKHLSVLDRLHKENRIEKITFVVGGIMKNDSQKGKSYGYYDLLLRVCEKNDWKIIVKNNRSKIILLDTDDGFFVIETSSNLNENPNIEQFSFEKSKNLYEFYSKIFDELEMAE